LIAPTHEIMISNGCSKRSSRSNTTQEAVGGFPALTVKSALQTVFPLITAE
jgi:hypothetical protein